MYTGCKCNGVTIFQGLYRVKSRCRIANEPMSGNVQVARIQAVALYITHMSHAMERVHQNMVCRCNAYIAVAGRHFEQLL